MSDIAPLQRLDLARQFNFPGGITMNRQQRRAQKAAAPVPPGTPHFSGADVWTGFTALQLFRKFNPTCADDPTFVELERLFNPHQEGTVGFSHGPRHLFYLFNSLCYLYGFASTGSAQFQANDGSDMSAEMAEQAADLLRRMYGWKGMDTSELPAKLESAKERARDLLVEMWADVGLIAKTSAQS